MNPEDNAPLPQIPLSEIAIESVEPIEPERYEMNEDPAYRFSLARREFFRVLGGGLIVLLTLPETTPSAAQESGGGRRRGIPGQPAEIGAWLHIGEDGQVTAYTGKVEVGQNIRTSLSQAVAEELRVPVASVRLVMGDTDRCPFDMGTFGSRTTPTMAVQLRKVAAVARELLVERASRQWDVGRSRLVVGDGHVRDTRSGKTLAFGQITQGQKLMKVLGEDVAITPAESWTVAGTSTPKVDGRDMVTGRHRYTSDVKRPGMLRGKVLRAPTLNATLVSADLAPAKAIPGVVAVRDGDFVGVAAPDEATAERAVSVIKAEWKSEPQIRAADLPAYFKKNPGAVQGVGRPSRHVEGSVADAFPSADVRLQAAYPIAYIAHAPLEPRAAVAEWSDGKVTVWTGTQRPFGVRGELAEAFGIPEERVRVLVPDTGSGYGGKHTGEAAIEAARLARAAGKPVKLIWTREEEFTWAYLRPGGLIEIASALGPDNKITAWEFHNYNSGAAGIRTPYAIPNQLIEFHATDSPLRQGSYRGLAATANHFARETHMDELAHQAKEDPLAFRRAHIEDARLRAVLDAAAEKFGWGKTEKRPNHGVGLACGTEKGGYLATCAEVSVNPADGALRVERVVATFECGAIVNPRHLHNQIEGAIVQGIGGALFEAIDFANGRLLNPHFSGYRLPRFADTPPIEIVLLDRKDLPSVGAGEAPIIGIAPALGNAIFDAVGVRLRSMPMAPDGVKGIGKAA